jgi:hypothetical protein
MEIEAQKQAKREAYCRKHFTPEIAEAICRGIVKEKDLYVMVGGKDNISVIEGLMLGVFFRTQNALKITREVVPIIGAIRMGK